MATMRDARLREAERKELLDRVAELEAENVRLTDVNRALASASVGELDKDADTILWWLGLLAESRRMHGQLPAHVAARIEGDAGPHELERVTAVLATVSAQTRAGIEATLERIAVSLRGLAQARGHAPDRRLRVVSTSASPPIGAR